MIQYYICNLEKRQDFSVDNVSFKRVEGYEERIEVLRKEKRDQLTFYAILDEKSSQSSKLYTGEETTSVNDMMILLSLAQSRNIYFPKAENINDAETNMWGKALGGNLKAHGFQIIMEHEIENFLNTSLTQIRRPDWLEKTGFAPAVFWWLESIYEGRPLETKFIAVFVALEVLANAHSLTGTPVGIVPRLTFATVRKNLSISLRGIGQQLLSCEQKELLLQNILALNHRSIRNKITEMRDRYCWDFMDDLMIGDWVKIRNKFMHEGTTRSLETMSRELRDTRYVQLVWSLQLALINLLGFGNLVQREYIVQEIREPLRNTFRDSGPFLVTT